MQTLQALNPRRNSGDATFYSAFDSLQLVDDFYGHGSRVRVSSDSPESKVALTKSKALSITVINNPRGAGVVVSKLSCGASGLRCGNVISAINGSEINSHQEAIAMVNNTPVGDELICTLHSPIANSVLVGCNDGSVGVTLEGAQSSGGVFVASVQAAGAAAAAGLQPGDEIMAIAGNVPLDHEEATSLFKTLKPTEQLQLLVVPGGRVVEPVVVRA